MDHELEGSMQNEDWFERVKRHIEGVIFRILKRKYPFLDSVAYIEGGYLYDDLDMKVTFFVSEEPDAETHRELVDQTNFMLQMFLIDKLNDKTATIDVALVLNN